MTSMTATKPRVIGIVLLCILVGILDVLGGIAVLALISSFNSGGDQLPLTTTLLAYLPLILGVLSFVTAVLLLMYKRIGLYLAAITFGIGLLLDVYSQVTGSGSLTTIGGIVLDLIVLYYVYIYLTREPQKTFFS